MTIQLIAILASAGLVTAGVAATSETRSASAIPAASMVGTAIASKAKTSTVSTSVRRGSRPACLAADVACLAQSGGQGVGGGVGGGGVSGGVLAAIAGGLGVTAVVIAAKGNDSKG